MEIYHKDRQISSDTCYPVGAVLPFAGVTPADGWLLCDGAAYDQSDYPVLYEVIGDLYRTTATGSSFNVPDLREKFIEGAGVGNYDVGKNIEPSIPSHSHSFTGTSSTSTSQGSHTHTIGDMSFYGSVKHWAYSNGAEGQTITNLSGVFSNTRLGSDSWGVTYGGNAGGTQRLKFDANAGWSGSSSEVGSHSHTFTAKGTVSAAGDSLAIYKGTTVQPKSCCMNFIIRCK